MADTNRIAVRLLTPVQHAGVVAFWDANPADELLLIQDLRDERADNRPEDKRP